MLDNQLKKQAQIRESLLAIIVIIGLCFACYMNLYKPKQIKTADLNKQIKEIVEKKTGIEKLNHALEAKQKLQSLEMQKQEQMAETLDPRILMIKNQQDSDYKDISQFLNQITKPDFKSSISINSLKYDATSKMKGYDQTKFFLVLSGRFANIIEFIDKLEDIPALISLDKIDIKTNPNDANMVNLDLSGTFYQLGNDNV